MKIAVKYMDAVGAPQSKDQRGNDDADDGEGVSHQRHKADGPDRTGNYDKNG